MTYWSNFILLAGPTQNGSSTSWHLKSQIGRKGLLRPKGDNSSKAPAVHHKTSRIFGEYIADRDEQRQVRGIRDTNTSTHSFDIVSGMAISSEILPKKNIVMRELTLRCAEALRDSLII